MYRRFDDISLEEAAVAEIEASLLEGLNDLDSKSNYILEGIDASSKLEDIKDVVEYASSSKGIDIYSAEAIRIAIDSVCDRVGYSPNYVYNFYAIENFQSDSSRIDSANIALEGIKDFLKNIWEKIKNALISLWKKAGELWEKYLSDTSRVKKALESMKEKVNSSSGVVKKDMYVENAPGKFKSAFPTANDISVNTIQSYINTHQAAFKALDSINDFADEIADLANKSNEFLKELERENAPREGGVKKIKEWVTDKLNKASGNDSESLSTNLMAAIDTKDVNVELGTNKNPLVGGIYITFKTVTTENGVDVEFKRENVDTNDDIGLSIASKGDLAKVIGSALGLINETIKKKNEFKRMQDDVKRSMQSIERAISTTVTDKDSQAKAKGARAIMDNYRKVMSKLPVIVTEKITRDVKLGRIILSYASYCLNRYE